MSTRLSTSSRRVAHVASLTAEGLVEGNAEGAKLPRRYVAEKTSPRALELNKNPPPFFGTQIIMSYKMLSL